MMNAKNIASDNVISAVDVPSRVPVTASDFDATLQRMEQAVDVLTDTDDDSVVAWVLAGDCRTPLRLRETVFHDRRRPRSPFAKSRAGLLTEDESRALARHLAAVSRQRPHAVRWSLRRWFERRNRPVPGDRWQLRFLRRAGFVLGRRARCQMEVA